MRILALVLPFLAALAVPVPGQEPDPLDLAVRQRLQEVRVDMQFTDADLPTVVAHFQNATKLNIVLDPHALEQMAGRLVTLRLKQVRAVNALRWLVRQLGLAWTVSNRIVVITTKDLAAGPAEFRLYDVSDILSQPRDFPPEEEAQVRPVSGDDLTDIIRSTVAREVWDTPPHSLQVAGSQLVVNAPPGTHAELARLLSLLRALAHFTLTFDAGVVDLAPGAFPGAPAAGSLAAGPVLLTREQASSLAAAPDDTVRVIETARFTCMNGQRTHVTLGHADGVPVGTVSRDSAAVAAVDVEMRARETRLEVSPILVVGRDRVLVDLRVTLADPGQEPEALECEAGRIACPYASERRLRTSVQVANGGAGLFVLGCVEDRVRALLLRVHSAAPPISTSLALQGRPEETQDAAPLQAFLAKKVSLSFDGQALSGVLQTLAEDGGGNVVIDPAVLDEGIADAPVSLRLEALPMELALRLVARMCDLDWTVRDEAVLIARPNRIEEPRTDAYDLRDLLWRRLDWPARFPDWGEEIAAAGLTPDGDTESNVDPEALVDLIRQNVAPSSWDEDERLAVVLWQGVMVVTQRPAVHEQLRRFLEQLRSARPRQVQVDARVLAVDPAVLDRLDLGGDGPLPDGARAALEQAVAEGRGRVDAAWSVAGMNARRLHALHWTRRTWVSGFDEGQPPVPVLQPLTGGWLLDVRPTLVSSEPGGLLVELRVACSDAPPEFERERVGLVAWLHRPRSSRAQLSTTVAMRSGELRLCSLGNGEPDGLRRILVWSVRELD